jgi:tRNA U34 5-methylaminomethyl-2-thiouridine-forming methyltransferase MnmC
MLHKHEEDFREIDFQDQFHVVYYDAFNPDVQPHLWTTEVFQRFYQAMQQDSILVTYCVKGIVKQALRANGFTLKRLPGPPGKREMLRASKLLSL